MGNCQAIDAASLVIQHPSGRVERLYWPVTANEVMKSNPGHYVALIITTCLSSQPGGGGGGDKNAVVVANGGVRVTRVKLLKPADILTLGQAYRLIDSQEVMKGLWAKKYAKMKKNELIQTTDKPVCPSSVTVSVTESEFNNKDVGALQERQKQKPTASSTSTRPRQWRPSLQSISEAGLSQQLQKTAQPQLVQRREGQFQRKVVVSQSS